MMANRWFGWAVLGSLASVGCSDDGDSAAGTDGVTGAGGTLANGGSGGTTTTSNGGSSNGGSAGAGGDPGCPERPTTQSDLFACDAPLSCPAVCAHLSLADCGGDLACGAELFADEEPGLLMLESRPGPGNAQGDTLTLLLAGGGAIRQTRYRYCDEFPCDFEEIPWEVYRQELCDVLPYRPCGADTCEPYPVTVNCAPLITEASCADLEQALAGEFSGNLDEGEICETIDDPECESSYSFVLTSDSWRPGFYELDIDQEHARLLCSVALVELSSARNADPSQAEGGNAGAGGASGEEQQVLYASSYSCEIIENSGGVSDVPRFDFDAGLVVHIPNRDPAELEVHDDAENVLLSHSIEPSTGCEVPEVPLTGP